MESSFYFHDGMIRYLSDTWVPDIGNSTQTEKSSEVVSDLAWNLIL